MTGDVDDDDDDELVVVVVVVGVVDAVELGVETEAALMA